MKHLPKLARSRNLSLGCPRVKIKTWKWEASGISWAQGDHDVIIVYSYLYQIKMMFRAITFCFIQSSKWIQIIGLKRPILRLQLYNYIRETQQVPVKLTPALLVVAQAGQIINTLAPGWNMYPTTTDRPSRLLNNPGSPNQRHVLENFPTMPISTNSPLICYFTRQ